MKLVVAGVVLLAIAELVSSEPARVFTAAGYSDLASGDGKFLRDMPANGSLAATNRCRSITGSGVERYLPASPETANWGMYYNGLEPALVINPGDTVNWEFATHEGGNAYDWMVKGDPNMERLYQWSNTEQTMSMRGAAGGGEGVHILTGPVYVCGAEPGDVLQVEVLDLKPRPNPGQGNRTYGSNTAGSWGYHYKHFLTNDTREVVTIYEVISDEAGNALYTVPDHQFRWANKAEDFYGVVTPCTVENGTVPNAAPDGDGYFDNNYSYPKGLGKLPCVNGEQSWPQYAYPGCIANKVVRDTSVRGKWRAPANLHIGNMGVAPAIAIPANSIPPTASIGGNVDNRRFGVGATIYYPVQVEGALLSAGDTHAAMGDSELDGTGIETSLNGRLRITLHKANALPAPLQGLDTILMENDDSWVVHGFSYNDYLSELGPNAQSMVFNISSPLDKAFNNTFYNARKFLMSAFNLTEDNALTAMTVGGDFIVTQVVDGNWGVHFSIPKYMFNMSITPSKPYMPTVVPGTSMPMARLQSLAATTKQTDYLNLASAISAAG